MSVISLELCDGGIPLLIMKDLYTYLHINIIQVLWVMCKIQYGKLHTVLNVLENQFARITQRKKYALVKENALIRILVLVMRVTLVQNVKLQFAMESHQRIQQCA